MANSTIGDLTSYTNPISSSSLPVWDPSNLVTKRVAMDAIIPYSYVLGRTSSSKYCTAYCDGVADDVQLQAAYDAVNAAGGGIIFMRAGTYNLSTTVIPKSNVILMGEGYATQVVMPTGTGFVNYFNSAIQANINNIKFINMRLTGTELTLNEGCIRLYNVQNMEITGCRIEAGGGFGVFNGAVNTVDGATQDTGKIWIHHNYMTGKCNQDIIGGGNNREPATRDWRDHIYESNFLYHDRAGSSGADSNAIDVVSAKYVKIVNNITHGHILLGNEKDPNKYSQIIGNTVRPPLNSSEIAAIYLQSDQQNLHQGGKCIISNNTVENGVIWVAGSQYQTVQDMVINSNVITQSSSYTGAGALSFSNIGLRLSYVERGTIVGNHIVGDGMEQAGVRLGASTDVNVVGNTVYNHDTGYQESTTGCTGNSFKTNNAISCTTADYELHGGQLEYDGIYAVA